MWNCWIENVETSNRFQPDPNFAGNIRIGVIESQFTGGEDYRVYGLDLGTGRVASQEVQHFAGASDLGISSIESSGAHIDRCGQNSPLVYSPNAKFVASCPNSDPDMVVIRAVDDNQEVCRVPLWRRRRVSGIVWSPRSNAIAVLERSSRRGWGPADILSAVSGHPVPYNWFAVEVHDISCSNMVAVNSIGRQFRYGWANIIEWH
jgi:hypothetical protein